MRRPILLLLSVLAVGLAGGDGGSLQESPGLPPASDPSPEPVAPERPEVPPPPLHPASLETAVRELARAGFNRAAHPVRFEPPLPEDAAAGASELLRRLAGAGLRFTVELPVGRGPAGELGYRLAEALRGKAGPPLGLRVEIEASGSGPSNIPSSSACT